MFNSEQVSKSEEEGPKTSSGAPILAPALQKMLQTEAPTNGKNRKINRPAPVLMDAKNMKAKLASKRSEASIEVKAPEVSPDAIITGPLTEQKFGPVGAPE